MSCWYMFSHHFISPVETYYATGGCRGYSKSALTLLKSLYHPRLLGTYSTIECAHGAAKARSIIPSSSEQIGIIKGMVNSHHAVKVNHINHFIHFIHFSQVSFQFFFAKSLL